MTGLDQRTKETATNELQFVCGGWIFNCQLSTFNSFAWGSDLSGSMQGAGWVGGLLSVRDSSGAHVVGYDGNGNVAALFGQSGESARYEYGPFGEVIRATGPMARTNPFRFSTKYQDDETDLLYYGYRYYSASTGRWLSRDPLGENGGENLYAFVGSDPLGQIDYLGLADSSEPSLSGKAGKAKPGECGAFTWPFTWQLTGGKTKKGGSIVQHVTWTFSISDSNGPLSNDDVAKQLGWDPSKSANYWELFKVDAKGEIDPKTDTWKGGPWPNTKGTITITGSASFYLGVFVPSGFALYPNSPAFGLLWTTTDPGLSTGLGTVSRSLTATWDCTCTSTNKKTKLSTNPK